MASMRRLTGAMGHTNERTQGMRKGQKIIGYRTFESKADAFGTEYRHFTLEFREFVVRDAAADVAHEPSDYYVKRLRTIKDASGGTQYLDEMFGSNPVEIRWQGNVKDGVADGEFYAPKVECSFECVGLLNRVIRGLPESDRINGVPPDAFIEHLESKGAIPVRYLSDLFSTWVYTETAEMPSC